MHSKSQFFQAKKSALSKAKFCVISEAFIGRLIYAWFLYNSFVDGMHAAAKGVNSARPKLGRNRTKEQRGKMWLRLGNRPPPFPDLFPNNQTPQPKHTIHFFPEKIFFLISPYRKKFPIYFQERKKYRQKVQWCSSSFTKVMHYWCRNFPFAEVQLEKQ